MSTGTEVATVTQKLVSDLASRYDLDPEAFKRTIVKTCFSADDAEKLTREEFFAFLMVANKHGLDPMTREIYAMRKKGGGIVPVVGVDGWLNLMNRNPNFDGMTFTDHLESPDGKKAKELLAITCRIHRKDRAHPIEATEYMAECRQQTQPWQKWPARMLRHKATIQAARLAFSFAGIVDPDEADRIKIATRDEPEREEPERPARHEDKGGPGTLPAEEKRGPGRPRKAPLAPPEEPTVAATQDIAPEETIQTAAAEIELVEYSDPDSGELRHVTVEEYDRLLKEEIEQAEAAEQARRAEEAQKTAAAEERRRKAEDMRRQLAELEGSGDGTEEQAETIRAGAATVTPEQKAANGELSQKLRAVVDKLPPKAPMPDIPAFLRRPKPALAPAPTSGPAWPNGLEAPDSFLKRLDAEFSRLDDGDKMQELWDAQVEPIAYQLFPPDLEEAQKIMRHHSSRVAP